MIIHTGGTGVTDAPVDYSSLPGGERKYALIGLSAVFGFLAILVVVLRFVARRMRKAKFSWDDAAILLALVFTIGVCVDSIVLATVGDVGAREFSLEGKLQLPIDEFTTLRYRRQIGVWILSWMSVLANGAVKVSVLLLYRRIFDVRSGAAFAIFRASLWIMLGVSTIWTISFFFPNLFICTPIDAFFYNQISECSKFENMWHVLAVSDVIIDGLILLLPLQPMRHLQLPLRRKLGIVAVFSTGLVVVVAGIVRAAIFYNVLDTPSPDAAYHNQPATLWAMIEASMGVIGACLPCLVPLFGARGIQTMVDSIRHKMSLSSLRQESTPLHKAEKESHDGWYSNEKATHEATARSLPRSMQNS